MRFPQVIRYLAPALTALGLAAAPGCSKPAESSSASPTRVALSWDTTRTHVFDLRLTTTSELTGAPADTTIVLESGVEVTLRDSAGTRQALIQLRSPRFADANGNPSPDAQPLALALAAPFALELADGVAKAYLEPATATQIAGFRRQIAAALQLQAHAPGSEWKGLEWDATGLANVQYRAAPGATQTWDYQKLGYERVVLAEHHAAQSLDTKQVAPKVEASSGRLLTDASGIVEVTRDEKLSVPLSASARLATHVVLSLKRSGFAAPLTPDVWQQKLDSLQRSAVGSPPPRGDHKLEDEARIGSHTFDEVVSKLTELENRPDGSRPTVAESAPLFHALVGIFRQQPDTVGAALKQVRERSPLSNTLLDALAMASSDVALQGLSGLAFDTTQPQATRLRAAGSLIRAQEPTAGAFEQVVKMLDDPLLHEQALYGLGSFVRQLRDKGNRALADAGAQVLLRQLKKASGPGDLAATLLAISNSGSGELFQAVLGYQDHADPAVRHAALQAVRLMPQPEAEARLRAALSRSDRSDVIEALHALGRRPTATRESVDRVETLAKKDPSADVRREAVLVLGLWSQFWPSLVPVLADLHEHDPDQRVREVAKPVSVQ